jgi:hypothetical protein
MNSDVSFGFASVVKVQNSENKGHSRQHWRRAVGPARSVEYRDR